MNAPPALAARQLLRAAHVATLATQHAGQPFASLVTPAAAPDGSVLLLLSALSAHTRHLQAEPRCALLVTGQATGANPQTTPRITLTGTASQEPHPAWRAHWLARHPYAAGYAAFTDFALWRITATSGHLVAGFAQAHTLAAADLAPPPAAAASIAAETPRILAHCNSTHRKALGLLAQCEGRSGNWHMSAIDPDGFDLAPEDADAVVLRMAFDQPADDADAASAAVARLLRTACVG